jgi:hypothetical protein
VELYSEENLLLYGRLLYDFARYCESKGIKLIFALTAYPDKGNAERLEKVKPLLRSAGIEHIDLFPPVHERYQDYNPRQLNANLADGHPGELLTTLYAEEVLSYLESSGHVTAEYEQADISYSADDECQLLRRLMTLSDKILFRVGAYVIRHMDSPFVGRSPNVIRGREHRKGYINRKIQQHCP